MNPIIPTGGTLVGHAKHTRVSRQPWVKGLAASTVLYIILLLKGYSMHVLKSSQLVIRRHDVNLKKCRYRKKPKNAKNGDLEKILKLAKK